MRLEFKVPNELISRDLSLELNCVREKLPINIFFKIP